jgi:hypothetical protein
MILGNDIERMIALADSLEREDRRAVVIQIWDDEIKDANALIVKALRAHIASALTSQNRVTP